MGQADKKFAWVILLEGSSFVALFAVQPPDRRPFAAMVSSMCTIAHICGWVFLHHWEAFFAFYYGLIVVSLGLAMLAAVAAGPARVAQVPVVGPAIVQIAIG